MMSKRMVKELGRPAVPNASRSARSHTLVPGGTFRSTCGKKVQKREGRREYHRRPARLRPGGGDGCRKPEIGGDGAGLSPPLGPCTGGGRRGMPVNARNSWLAASRNAPYRAVSMGLKLGNPAARSR